MKEQMLVLRQYKDKLNKQQFDIVDGRWPEKNPAGIAITISSLFLILFSKSLIIFIFLLINLIIYRIYSIINKKEVYLLWQDN